MVSTKTPKVKHTTLDSTQTSNWQWKKARQRYSRSPSLSTSASYEKSDSESSHSLSLVETTKNTRREKKGRGRATEWTKDELTFLNELIPAYRKIPRNHRNGEMRTFKAGAMAKYVKKFSKLLGQERVDVMAPVSQSWCLPRLSSDMLLQKVPKYFEYYNRLEKKAQERKEMISVGDKSIESLQKRALGKQISYGFVLWMTMTADY